jgi:hypothetical protein
MMALFYLEADIFLPAPSTYLKLLFRGVHMNKRALRILVIGVILLLLFVLTAAYRFW